MSSQRRFQIVHRDRPTGKKTVPTPQQGQVSKTSGKTDTQTPRDTDKILRDQPGGGDPLTYLEEQTHIVPPTPHPQQGSPRPYKSTPAGDLAASYPYGVPSSLQPLLPRLTPSSRPTAPRKARSRSWCPSPPCQGSRDAQTHPVCRAEPLHDHCGAERAGWVHGAAGEIDLDTEVGGEGDKVHVCSPRAPALPGSPSSPGAQPDLQLKISSSYAGDLSLTGPCAHSSPLCPERGPGFLPPLQLPLIPLSPQARGLGGSSLGQGTAAPPQAQRQGSLVQRGTALGPHYLP